MHALPLMVVVLCAMALAYRYYSAFLAAKVLSLDDARVTPAHASYDGQNYAPTHRWVLFGHHFAAIAGAGPLIGPVLAAQYGWLPGLLWLLVGVVLGGAVQDFTILVASMRRNGKSLAEIAALEIGPAAGTAAAVAILFVVVVALGGLGFVVVNALAESSWGSFTIFMSIPLALAMGWYIYRLRSGTERAVKEATVFGVLGLIAAVVLGKLVPQTPWLDRIFHLSRHEVTLAMMVYGFVASVLPVWLLLIPRDYLSSFMKIGTFAVLILGTMLVNPVLKFPALSEFLGGGPIVPGHVFPFVFITIMCGAISGFHALVSSGTTPKMIDKESHARSIGYGCMLMEGMVGVVCLVATASMNPGDYYAINVPGAEFAKLAAKGLVETNLPALTQAVGEATLRGRTGGSVSLAVGMAQIFSGLPGLHGLMQYWYHFAIMFEALFILTTIDAGTRIARFILQEFLGKAWEPFGRTNWAPGAWLSTGAVVAAWGWLIWNASIRTIWPMFGIANQMLAVIALCVAAMLLFNAGKGRYAWTVLLPMAFVTLTTTTAALEMIVKGYWPAGASPAVIGINVALILVFLGCTAVIFAASLLRWRRGPGSAAPAPRSTATFSARRS